MDYSLIAHAAFWIHNTYSGQFLFKELEGHEGAAEANNFVFRYITSWNMIAQWIFLSMALYVDILKYLPKTKRRQIVGSYLTIGKGYLFSTIVFPTTLTVAGVFWGLYSMDEDYIIHGMRHFMPKWLNHSIHTNIVFVVFIEMLIMTESMPKPSLKTAVITNIIFGIIYAAQYMSIYYQYGRFLYGVFYVLTWPERIAFTTFTNTMTALFVKLGYVLQNWKCGENTLTYKTK